MANGLVERAREASGEGNHGHGFLLEELADCIEANLKREHGYLSELSDYAKNVSALRARVKQLEEALGRITREDGGFVGYHAAFLRKIARAALQRESE